MRKIADYKTLLQIAGALAVTLGSIAMSSSDVSSQVCPQTSTTWATTITCRDSSRVAASGGGGSGASKQLATFCSGSGCGSQTGFAVAHGLTSGGSKVCEISSTGATTQVNCPSSAVKHRVWAVAL